MFWLKVSRGFVKNGNGSDMKIEEIPVDLIKPNPYQPRKNFSKSALEELSRSIREYGVIQPITVRKVGSDGYELVAGERRLRASKMAGLSSIPAIIIDTQEKDSAMIALIENLQRENLHYLEEAEGYLSLIRDHGLTQEELAKKLGKSQSTIANKIRILKLPASIKKLLVEHDLSERHARALLRIPDEELQQKVMAKIIKNKYNVRQTEALVERILQNLRTKKQKSEKRKIIANYKDLRILVNTIKNAVSMIKDSGLVAQFNQIDREDGIEIIVRISKG